MNPFSLLLCHEWYHKYASRHWVVHLYTHYSPGRVGHFIQDTVTSFTSLELDPTKTLNAPLSQS